MAAIRTVEDLSTDPEFFGYYDIEETHKYDLEDMRETAFEKGSKQKATQTAKSLLEMNVLTIEQIAEVTNLSIEEINTLK